MSTLFSLLTVGFVIAIPVLFFVLIIKAIRKKSVKKTVWGMLGCFVGVVVSMTLFDATNPMNKCEHEFNMVEEKDASCMMDGKRVQKCNKCGKRIEEIIPKLAHEWEEATCSKPKTCMVCNTEEGTTLEHTLGEWEIVNNATIDEQGTRQQKCEVCKTVINTEKFDSSFKLAEKVVEESVKNHSGKVWSLEVMDGEEENSALILSAIGCENSEQIVNDILSAITEALKSQNIKAECLLYISDIKDGEDGECLASATIDLDGSYEITPMSLNFKTERNEWITSQFSAWDGSHTILNGLIKDNLNDENSFEHIETTYIDVTDEEKLAKVNETLSNAGYAQRVEIGDLFIITDFSAKNAFNATVKNTAFGIVDYSEDLVTLIGIE